MDNRGVRIHYLESNGDPSTSPVPVVYIPGAFGLAESFLREMSALAPRRSISIDLRGRGKSDAPETGYSFHHNVSDIQTVVDTLQLNHFCLTGFSVGVAYAVGCAYRHPDRITGLILIDYPARYPRFPSDWVERWFSGPSFKGNLQAAHQLQRESADIQLWDKLDTIKCPVLVLRGGRPDALLGAEQAERFRQHLRDVEVVVFEDSGHNVSEPDFERFIGTMKKFLERLDPLRAP